MQRTTAGSLPLTVGNQKPGTCAQPRTSSEIPTPAGVGGRRKSGEFIGREYRTVV